MHNKSLVFLWFLPIFFGGQAIADEVSVEGLRLWAGPESTRVVLDISAPVSHRVFTMADPARLVIDLDQADWLDGQHPQLPQLAGAVSGIRHGRRAGGNLRVVLDLNRPVRPNSFVVAPNDLYGHRLVVDLGLGQREGKTTHVKRAPVGERDVIVAIDPGHGGEDPGAIGRRGTREKDVTMGIARRLANLIDQEPGMRAQLIRDGDYQVSLRGRIELARQQHADMFVSIHADAFKDERARGSSVYILSRRGASSEAALWLAERENAADLVGGVSLDDKDDVLASVLLDLSQTATISASMTAGEHVLTELAKVGRVRRSDVQQAGFAVLKSPDIPSILVETAFISNPAEEKRLRDGKEQARWAAALLAGIRGYFYVNPPPGTRIAALGIDREITRTYVISRGDTLSDIADRFNISLRTLRAANRLKSDSIRIGQVLTIPGKDS